MPEIGNSRRQAECAKTEQSVLIIPQEVVAMKALDELGMLMLTTIRIGASAWT